MDIYGITGSSEIDIDNLKDELLAELKDGNVKVLEADIMGILQEKSKQTETDVMNRLQEKLRELDTTLEAEFRIYFELSLTLRQRHEKCNFAGRSLF